MQQSELQALGQHIQVKLQQLPSPIRLRIRCAFREEALLVLAEHLLHVEPAPQPTFTAIAGALQEYTPELMKSGLVRSGIGGTKFLPVRIYLRVAGYQQPYDSFVFSLKPAAPPTSINPPIPVFVPPPVVVAPPEPATPQLQVEPEIAEVEPVLEVEPVAEFPLAAEVAPLAEAEPAAEVELATEIEVTEEQSELSDDSIAEIAPANEPAVAPEIVAPGLIEAEPVVEVEPIPEVEPSTEITVEQPQISDNSTEFFDNSIAEIAPANEPAVAPEIVAPELIEAEPAIEVEPIPEVELFTEIEITEEQPQLLDSSTEFFDNSITQIAPATEPAVEPEIVAPEITEAEPVVEVEPIPEVELSTEIEITEEQTELPDNSTKLLDDSIAKIAPTEPAAEPEIVEAEPVVEVELIPEVEISTEIEIPEEQAELSDNSTELLDDSIARVTSVTEPAVEPEIVEPETIEAEPVVEVEPITEAEIFTKVEIPEEQTELSDNPIAEITPVIEPATLIETSDSQTDWVSDRPIAENTSVEIAELDPVIAEAATDEPVFAESFDALQSPDLADLIPEEIAELSIAEEAIAEPPTIALEDPLVEPEAIEEFLLLEEISLAPVEEISPPQEITVVPAAIDPIAGNVALTADETSFTQNEIQDEPELAVDLPEAAIAEEAIVKESTVEEVEEAIVIQDEPELAVDLPEEAIAEEAIVIQDEPESVVDLQEEPIVEEPSQAATFSPPIPHLYNAPDTQPTTPDFFPEYSALPNAELIDPASPAELKEIETVDEPEIVEVLDLPELDSTPLESSLNLELKETLEPENLAIDYVPPLEKIVAAEPAVVGEPLANELYIHSADPKTQISSVSLAPEAPVTQPPRQPVRVPQLSSSSIMMGTAIALFGLLGGWYIFSRPCVLGSSCEPLQQAQQISQAAFQTVQSTESANAIAKAYDDLGTANKLLKSIPSWSGQHQAAQSLIADNDAKSAVIGQLIRTLRKGNEAANRSQNPPHPLPEWREIQRLWRESIAALEKIPNNTAIYPVAQRKATEYRANLDGINKRVIVEQQAQEEVDNAKKTAQLAETRTGIATSAAGWRDVYTSWQAAINLLKNVPKGAAARLEAEELLKIYQIKLVAAGTRRDQENTAIAAYTEAIAQAEKAQSFQQKNQWQKAIGAWEGALANVQKVAQSTTPYTQAQPLIATYKTALTQAQGGLRTSEAIQAAKPALDRSCGGTPKVCQYDAAPTAIRVQITYGYDQMVESAMTSAQTKGNSAAQAGVVSQVNTFLQELALISQTSQVPIDLYNANGSKFGTYSPKASGFIPQ